MITFTSPKAKNNDRPFFSMFVSNGKAGLLSVILLFVVFIVAGCTAKQPAVPLTQTEASVFPESEPSLFDKEIAKAEAQREKATAQRKEQKKKDLKPKFKELSPLDSERINASFTEESYRPIFQILARAAGLNLVLAPELEQYIGDNKLTAEYQEIKVRTILDAICAIFNVAWHEEHSTLFIEPYLTKTIHLDFVVGINQSSFSVGGDVLGGSGGGSNSEENINIPLNGRFEVQGEISDNVTDIYSNIESTVGQRLQEDGEFLLNRQTGTLMVKGRPRNIEEITTYLEELRRKYSRQVLIEAQIIEVNLDESQTLGIDWRNFSLLASKNPIQDLTEAVVNVSGEVSGDDSFYNLVINDEYYSMGAVFRALKQYGNLKLLSNPRLKAMNGQSAVISVGQSISYLRSLTKTTEGTGNDRTVDITTEIGSIFDGILLGVTPIIKNDDSVTLHIVPIKSELVELDQEQIGDDSVRITFPKVNLREISTIVNIKPENIVVLGGLIMEREGESEMGLPILSDLPFIGYLFKERRTEKQKVEMVIILRLEVLD